jgi:hypothetical protein
MDIGSASRVTRASAVTRTAGRCVQSDDAFGYPGIDQNNPIGTMTLYDGKQDGGKGEYDYRVRIGRHDTGDCAHAAAFQTSMIVESNLSAVVCGGLLVGAGAMMTITVMPIAVVTVMLMMRGGRRMMLMGLRAHGVRRRQMLGDARTPCRTADDQRRDDCANEKTMEHPAHASTIKTTAPPPQGGRCCNR